MRIESCNAGFLRWKVGDFKFRHNKRTSRIKREEKDVMKREGQAINGLRLRIYWCWWILSAIITVASCVIPASRKRFFILSSSPGNTETILEVVDGFFNIDTNLVGFIPFCWAAFDARIRAEIFLRIDVDHSSAGRSCAGVIAAADAAFGFICRIVFPFHFGAYKLHGWNLTF